MRSAWAWNWITKYEKVQKYTYIVEAYKRLPAWRQQWMRSPDGKYCPYWINLGPQPALPSVTDS